MPVKLFLSFCLVLLAPLAYADLSDDVDDEPLPQKEILVPKKPAAPKTKPPAQKSKKTKKPIASEAPSASAKKPAKKPSKEKQPVRFTSVGARGNRDKGLIELKKKVRVFQEDFSLSSNKATIFLNKKTDEVDRVEATGNVRLEKVDVQTGERIKAKAQSAVFYEKEQKVVLRGNASFMRGKDLIKGKVITYEMDSGWISAEKVDGIVSP